jgi:hypothetical protein
VSEYSLDIQFDGCLNTWGISLLDEWDLLVFLHRHSTSLITVEQISKLLGYGPPVIAKALENMERAGLVQRSRPSRGTRIYHLAPSVDSSRQGCFELLLKLIEMPIGPGLAARRLVHAPLTGKKLRRTGLYLT